MIRKYLILTAAFLAMLECGSAAEIQASVSGLKSADGDIVFCLWDQPDGFPICGDGEAARQTARAIEGASVKFSGLPPGDYAITAFHDADRDGKLKQGFGGRPLESVGVSNNPERRMGRPKIGVALFRVDESAHVEIRLR